MQLKHNGFGETLSIAVDGDIVVCGHSNSVQVSECTSSVVFRE
jgi:hypothetical protein